MKWCHISAVMYRNLKQFPVDASRLFGFFYHPLIDLVFIGMIGIWACNCSVQSVYAQTLLLGIVLLRVMQRVAGDAALSLVEELVSVNVTNLFATPLTLGEWIVGVALAEMGLSMLMVAFCALMVKLMYGFVVFSIGWYFGVIWLGMFLAGIPISFLAISLIMIGGKRFSEMIWIIAWAFAPFSGAYFPVQALPAFMRAFAYILPMGYFMEAVASVARHEPMLWDKVAIGFGLDLFYLVLFGSLVFAVFRVSKKRGLVRLMD